MTIHLRSITLPKIPLSLKSQYPFTVPVVQSLEPQGLSFPTDVTFFVGENGSGKSTILEAMALAMDAVTVGSESVSTDESLGAMKRIVGKLKLVWNQRATTGFFMRSEDFFGFTKSTRAIRQELERELELVDEEYEGRSEYAKNLAKMPYRRELADLQQRYGDDLDARSHGESYFTLFEARLVPNGLYLLDEPEAPLSPMKQLTLLALLHRMVQDHGAQFIIATHSPLLMAYPGATIYGFDGGAIHPLAYDDVEHVTVTRTFLKNPDHFLRHLAS
jgi:predicted ATPase